ncbi:iron-sulfur cluster insertion protein ErpA [Rickettsiella massiliensis]|uniref:iron-sulfur cluster insertion protein ErpA n=1 Tax=Rickettsiella massiliensis TaxID=676517 RepID=UPI00029A4C32|nr:iron-sulfur cluster insertion protein ErpA [Rickettsiella massiliensis]
MSELKQNVSQSKVTVTHAAAYKVWSLIQEEGNSQLKLRVFITGGGCSGFQYGFTFDEEDPKEDDTVIRYTLSTPESETETSEVLFVIDPMSLIYLTGAEIDYKSDLSGEQFIIRNPNAKTTCGCGSSFSA